MDSYMTWRGADGEPLLALGEWREGGAILLTDEREMTLTREGGAETVPGTGLRVWAGSGVLLPGSYTLSVTALGHGEDAGLSALELQREITRAARLTRWIDWEGRTLPILGFSSLSRTRRANPRAPRTVDVTFEPGSAYWMTDSREAAVPMGVAAPVWVGGMAPAPLRVRITAGAQPVTDPALLTDAGLTVWRGTLGAGQTLDIDGSPGRWAVMVGETDERLRLTGPQPFLRPGERTVTVTAPGASAVLAWTEGEL